MSSPPLRELSADEFLSLPDEELDTYERQFENSAIPIRDESLSQDKFEKLRERLLAAAERNRIRKESSNQAPPDQLIAQLTKLKEAQGDYIMVEEEDAYQELVNDGARPLYPIDLPRETARRLEEYKKYIEVWESDADPTFSFNLQLFRWRDFQRFQQWVRTEPGHDSKEVGISSLLPRKSGPRVSFADLVEGESRYAEGPQFQVYTQIAKLRIAQYVENFEETLDLKEDLTQQSTLASWLEYLAFECWMLWFFSESLAKSQETVDAAWKKLKESGLVEANATHKVTDREQIKSERQQMLIAKDNMERLQAAQTALPTGAAQPSHQEQQRAIDSVQEACNTYNDQKSRYDQLIEFMTSTSHERFVLDSIRRHLILIEWIQSQITKIKEEAQPLEETRDQIACAPTGSRKRHLSEASNEGPPSKSRRTRARIELSPVGNITSETSGRLDRLVDGIGESSEVSGSRKRLRDEPADERSPRKQQKALNTSRALDNNALVVKDNVDVASVKNRRSQRFQPDGPPTLRRSVRISDLQQEKQEQEAKSEAQADLDRKIQANAKSSRSKAKGILPKAKANTKKRRDPGHSTTRNRTAQGIPSTKESLDNGLERHLSSSRAKTKSEMPNLKRASKRKASSQRETGAVSKSKLKSTATPSAKLTSSKESKLKVQATGRRRSARTQGL